MKKELVAFLLSSETSERRPEAKPRHRPPLRRSSVPLRWRTRTCRGSPSAKQVGAQANVTSSAYSDPMPDHNPSSQPPVA
jgi:hypothetical protein